MGIKLARWSIEVAVQNAANIAINGEGSLKKANLEADRVAARFGMDSVRVREMVDKRISIAAFEQVHESPRNFM